MDLKVTLISYTFPGQTRGFCPGLERLAEGIATGLSSKGVDVCVLTSRRMNRNHHERMASGIEVFRVPSLMQYKGTGFMAIGQMHFCLAVYKHHLHTLRNSDIIQIIGPSFIPVRSMLSRKVRTFSYFPHYDSPHTIKEFFYLPMVNELSRIIYKQSDVVIAGVPPNSPEIKAFNDRFRIPVTKVGYVFEGFDPAKFYDAPRNEDLLRQFGENMILYVGPLVKRKGLDALIQAFQIVLKEIPDAQLVLAGTVHEYGKTLRNLANKLGILSNVSFIGFVPEEDLPAYYQTAKIFAFPSLLEGYPLTVLEAMACGTPVVASKLTTIELQLEDTGILVEPRDVRGIAKAIIQLLNDEELRATLSQSTRQRAMSMFSWSRVAEQYLQIYGEFDS